MPSPFTTACYFHLIGLSTPRTRLQRTAHYRAFLEHLSVALRTHPVRVLSYCLLPDAWHLVVGPTGPAHLEALLQRVAATQPHEPFRPLPIIARPLRTGAELIGHCVSVERRPVAQGLVMRAEDWPWCSPAARFRLVSKVPLVTTRVLMSQAWLDHLNAPRPSDASRLGLVPRDDFSKQPGLLVRLAKGGEQTIDVRAVAHQHHPHPHIEGAEHLVVAHAPGRLQPRKDGRHHPAAPVD